MSYEYWDANLLVVIATILAVGSAVMVHYEGLGVLSNWLLKRQEHHQRIKVLYAIFGILFLHIIEIWIFGFFGWLLLEYPNTGTVNGAHPLILLDSVYLAAASFTTVGFGDLTPVGPIRFLSGTTGLTGLVLITWSASFTYYEMERFWRK
jgi:hypothetical protein